MGIPGSSTAYHCFNKEPFPYLTSDSGEGRKTNSCALPQLYGEDETKKRKSTAVTNHTVHSQTMTTGLSEEVICLLRSGTIDGMEPQMFSIPLLFTHK